MSPPDQFGLGGRRVLLTGGSRGLGWTMAHGLADAGASVVAVARTATDGGDQRVRSFQADVADLDAMPGLVDRAEEILDGPIDTVVHAAGVQHRSEAVSFPLEAWQQLVAVNLTAPFALSQEVGRRQLSSSVQGSHIFVASLTSQIGLPNLAAYAATKSGVMGVVRTLAVEWATRGVRVNAVGPGYFRTALTEALFQNDAERERLNRRIPMGRFGQPEDLCGPVVFLASDASRYVTGQLLMVDGGWTAG
jgi:NAD(P)-dependent dehydrogenase (short-subunit alcohol dehydrogenase family)